MEAENTTPAQDENGSENLGEVSNETSEKVSENTKDSIELQVKKRQLKEKYKKAVSSETSGHADEVTVTCSRCKLKVRRSNLQSHMDDEHTIGSKFAKLIAEQKNQNLDEIEEKMHQKISRRKKS